MAGLNFDSFESLQAFIKVKEENEFFQMWTASSRSIESIRKRGIRRPVKDTLKYYELSYRCIFGGSRKSKSTGKRPNQSSCKRGCPFLMRLKASSDGNYLQVVEFVDKHNHVHDKNWIDKNASARGQGSRRKFRLKTGFFHSRLTPIVKIMGLPPTTSTKASIPPHSSADEIIYPPDNNFYITQPVVLREGLQPMEQESSDFDQYGSSDASNFESSSITMTDTLMKDLKQCLQMNSQQILLNELSKSAQMSTEEIPTLSNSEQMLLRELSKSEQTSTKESTCSNENEDIALENSTLIKQEPPDETSESESIPVSLSPYPIIMSAVSVSSIIQSPSPITASVAPISSIKPPPLVIAVTPVSSTTESPTPVVAPATPISSTSEPVIVVPAAVFSTKEPQVPITISATSVSSAKEQAPTIVSLTKSPQTPVTISGAVETSTEPQPPVIVSADPVASVESQSPISSPASPKRISLQALRKRAHGKNKRSTAQKAADVLTAIAEKNCLVLERIATAMEIQATQAVKQTNLIHQMIDLLSKK